MRLSAALAGERTWSEIFALISQLPRQSRFATAVIGHTWEDRDYLLAYAVDLLAGANWQRGGGKGRQPQPLRRPGDENVERYGGKTTYSVDEMRALLDRYSLGKT